MQVLSLRTPKALHTVAQGRSEFVEERTLGMRTQTDSVTLKALNNMAPITCV
jgi:hypothetical protein